MRGIVDDVGGRIFETSSKKTTMERSTEMVRVIFSPDKETVRVGFIEMKNEVNALVGIGVIRGFEFSNSARNDL